jgi:hypothetical protein
LAVTTSLFRIAELPPPLVADDAHVQRVLRRHRVLDGDQGSGRDQEEHEDDQRRDDRPGELDLVAAVDLRRLAILIAGAGAEADDAVDEQAGDDDEDHRGDAEHQHRQRVDAVGRRRVRIEDARDVARHGESACRYDQAGQQPECARRCTLSYPAPPHAPG